MKSGIVFTRKSSSQSMALFMKRSSSSSISLLPLSTLKVQKANVSTSEIAHNKIINSLKLESASNQSLSFCYETVRCYSANANNKSDNNYNNNVNGKPLINKKANYKYKKNNNKRNFRQNDVRNNLESIRKEFYVLMRELERRCTHIFAFNQERQYKQQELEIEKKKKGKNVNDDKNKNKESEMTESKEKEQSDTDTNAMYNENVNDDTNKNKINIEGDFVDHNNYYGDDGDDNDELRVQDQRLLEQLGVTELFSLYKNNDHKNKSISEKNEQEKHEASTVSQVIGVNKTSNTNIKESMLEKTRYTNADNEEEIEELRRFIEVMCDVHYHAHLSPRVWLDKCVHRIFMNMHHTTVSVNNENTQEPSILAMQTDEESSFVKHEKGENVNLNTKKEAEHMLSSLFTLKAATVLMKTSCERLSGKRYKMHLYLAHPNILYKEQSAMKKIEMERLEQSANNNVNVADMNTVHNKLHEEYVFTTSEEQLLNKLVKETNDMHYILHFFNSKLITEFNDCHNIVYDSDSNNNSNTDTDNDVKINENETKTYKSKLTELFNMCKANNIFVNNENYVSIDETEFQSILLFLQAYVELAAELNEMENHTNTENGVHHLPLAIGEAVQAIMDDLMTFLEKNEEVISDNYQDRKEISINTHSYTNAQESRKMNLVRCVRYVNEETIRSICCSAVKVFACNASGFENGYSLFVRFLQWKHLHNVNQNKIHQQSSSASSYVISEEEEAEVEIENENLANNSQDSLEYLQTQSVNSRNTTKKEEEKDREEHKQVVNVLESETSKYKRDSSFQELTRIYYEDALYFMVALTYNFTSTVLLCQSVNSNSTLVYNYDMIANLFIKLIKETEIGYKMPLCTTLTRETFIRLLHSLSHVCTINQFRSISDNVNKNISNSSSLSLWGYDWLHNMYKTVLQNSSLEMHRQEVNSENEHDRILLAALLAMSSCVASSCSSSSSSNIYNDYYSVSDAMEILFVHNSHNHNDSENDSIRESKEADNDDDNNISKEENETNSKTSDKHYNNEKLQIIKLLNKGTNNKLQMWSNNALLLFNKLQRPHSTLKMTEREVALQCVLLKLVNHIPSYRVILSSILLRHTFNKFDYNDNNKENKISIPQNTKRIHIDNANALIQSAICEAEIIFTRYMSYLQQQSYIPINVRHGLVVEFLIIYCTLMDFTCIIKHYEIMNTNKTKIKKEHHEKEEEDTVHLITDFSDITAMMYVILDQNTLNTSRQEEISVSRDLYAVRTFYLHLLVLYCQLQTRIAEQHHHVISNEKINDSSKITEYSLFNSQNEVENALCNLQQWVETLCSVNKVRTVPVCVLQLLHSLHSLLAKYNSDNSNKNKICVTKFMDYVLEICHKLTCEGANNENESTTIEEELYKDDWTSKYESLTLCLHWCKLWNEQEIKCEWNALKSLSVFSQHVQELLTKYDNIINEYKKCVESNVGEEVFDKRCTKDEVTHDNDDDDKYENDVVFFRANTTRRSNRFFTNVNKL